MTLNEFNINYGVNLLEASIDQIEQLLQRLNPSNPNSELSLEERYAARQLLQHLIVQINMLAQEVAFPTGEEKKSKKKFFRK